MTVKRLFQVAAIFIIAVGVIAMSSNPELAVPTGLFTLCMLCALAVAYDPFKEDLDRSSETMRVVLSAFSVMVVSGIVYKFSDWPVAMAAFLVAFGVLMAQVVTEAHSMAPQRQRHDL
ncbi:MAG: hypothetical protein ACXWLH_00275 [Candidatus Saccharimonadales bacterium]